MDKLDLSTKAQELRELLGEDANSPVDVFSLANQIEGLTLVFYPLGENISGMCVRDQEIKLIAIKIPKVRMKGARISLPPTSSHHISPCGQQSRKWLATERSPCSTLLRWNNTLG